MSEMTKHTLPPWRVNDTNVFQDNALGSVVMIASCGGSVLTYEERKANARLIGVAPETAAERDRLRETNSNLLAALKNILRIIGGSRDPASWFTYAEVAEVFDAIRKAEEGD